MAIDDRRRTEALPLRISAFRGDARVVVISPGAGGRVDADVLAWTLRDLADRGVRRVLTGALHPPEVEPFARNGFAVTDRLHLLRHDLLSLPPIPRNDVQPRRGRGRDRDAILDLDGRAFDDLWAMDRKGVDDAIRATPSSRFVVLRSRRSGPLGYGITGRAGDRGYLQRIAVDPDHHRSGLGRLLVADALRWLGRRGARTALVNTQVTNDAARSLYLSCGFVAEPVGLVVLGRDLGGDP